MDVIWPLPLQHILSSALKLHTTHTKITTQYKELSLCVPDILNKHSIQYILYIDKFMNEFSFEYLDLPDPEIYFIQEQFLN